MNTEWKSLIVIAALFMAVILFATLSRASPVTPAPPVTSAPAATRPYSCRLLDDAEKKCAFGQCDRREMDRLRKECLRDGGRP